MSDHKGGKLSQLPKSLKSFMITLYIVLKQQIINLQIVNIEGK